MTLIEVLVPLGFFACIFGVLYLHYNSRHRERMALIEKGENAGLFYPESGSYRQSRRFSLLSFALALMGIGTGIAIAIFLSSIIEHEAIFPACIFFMAGLGLFTSFKMSAQE